MLYKCVGFQLSKNRARILSYYRHYYQDMQIRQGIQSRRFDQRNSLELQDKVKYWLMYIANRLDTMRKNFPLPDWYIVQLDIHILYNRQDSNNRFHMDLSL